MRTLGLPATSLLAVAIGLAGCGGGGSAASSSTPPPAAATTSADPYTSSADAPSDAPSGSPSGSPSDSAAAAGKAAGPAGDAPVTLRKSASSPAYGDSWTVEQVVRHFPVPASLPAMQGREVVAVKVKIKSGTQFYTVFGRDSFSLVGDDGQENSSTGVLDAALAKAGLTPVLADARRGKASEGWIAFFLVHPDSTSLTLRYHQLAAKVIGSGKTIPKKDIDLRLVG